jgi:hypothetical protein
MQALADSLDHRRFRNQRNPRSYESGAAIALTPLARANTYEQIGRTVPEFPNRKVIGLGTYDGKAQFSTPAFLYGLSASSDQPEGFQLELIDFGSGKRITQTRLSSARLRSPIHLLPTLQPITEPGIVTVRIINLSPVTNNIQLVLRAGVPSINPLAAPNEYDLMLTQMADAHRRETGSVSITPGAIQQGTGATPAQLSNQDAEKKLAFHFQKSIITPIADATEYVVISEIVPTGYTAYITDIANRCTDQAYSEISAKVIWKILIDGAAMPGFGNITTSQGEVSRPRPLSTPMIARSGQTMEYRVSVLPGAEIAVGAASGIVCTLEGYLYPDA